MLDEKQVKALNSIRPVDGLRYFSGFMGASLHSIPLIYQHSGKKFCIVGPGHESSHDNLKDAVRTYKKAFKHLFE